MGISYHPASPFGKTTQKRPKKKCFLLFYSNHSLCKMSSNSDSIILRQRQSARSVFPMLPEGYR